MGMPQVDNPVLVQDVAQSMSEQSVCVRPACGGVKRDPHAALRAMRVVVGEAFVESDQASLSRLARSTLPDGTSPLACIRPSDVNEVRQIVLIAAEYGLALHPISRGRNWGYGDRCAVAPGQVILDLSRMNRIHEIHPQLGYATVEPGVSQGQLAAYLDQSGLPFMGDATGAGPDASLVGNALQRGCGHTAYGERFSQVCGLEVLLPDGNLLKTGFGHYAKAQATGAYRWGVGPSIDGLFSQSNFGIVTRMTFWLMPKPECTKAFFISLRREDALPGLIEALRPLRMNGTLNSPIHIFNDLRLISSCQSYPWEEHKKGLPLGEEVVRTLRAKHGIGAWLGCGGLYGSRGQVSASLRLLKRALRGVPGLEHLYVVDEFRLKLARLGLRMLRPLRSLGIGARASSLLEKVELVHGLLSGKPSARCLKGAHWRVRRTPDAPEPGSPDPLDHNAGFYWLSPILPQTGGHVKCFEALVKPIIAAHGFEYQVTFCLVTPRALCAVTTLSFDRSDEEEGVQARSCYERLLRVLLEAGYPPYRVGPDSMPHMDHTSEVFWDVVARLKKAFDPKGVFAPGFYDPAAARALRNDPVMSSADSSPKK